MDVLVTVNTVWTGPSGALLSVSHPVMKSLTLYTSSGSLNFVQTVNSGDYICTVRIGSDTKEVSARANIMIGIKQDINFF